MQQRERGASNIKYVDAEAATTSIKGKRHTEDASMPKTRLVIVLFSHHHQKAPFGHKHKAKGTLYVVVIHFHAQGDELCGGIIVPPSFSSSSRDKKTPGGDRETKRAWLGTCST